ncbi:MAG: sulfotransferase family 2 domain-containing protein [Pseudomonadota bacterium]
MIISPSRKFVFVHLPKTGGTAFTLAYESIARADDLLFGDTPKAARRQKGFRRRTGRSLRKHAKLAEAVEALPELDLTAFTVATIVRNPWDRMLSFYAWGRTQTFAHPMTDAAKELPFAQFLADPRVTTPLRTHPTPSYVAGVTPHLLRQETLAAECAALDLPLPPLARVNISDRPADYRSAYTDDTAALVPPLFRYETETLGYRF